MLKISLFFKKLQTSRANNLRILWIKNVNFSGYCFYMNTNIQEDFFFIGRFFFFCRFLCIIENKEQRCIVYKKFFPACKRIRQIIYTHKKANIHPCGKPALILAQVSVLQLSRSHLKNTSHLQNLVIVTMKFKFLDQSVTPNLIIILEISKKSHLS